jgi:hypothetical protein
LLPLAGRDVDVDVAKTGERRLRQLAAGARVIGARDHTVRLRTSG